MWRSNEILAKYELLKDLFPIEVGEKIARGFADLGFEEFYLVTPTKMVSIFTGQTSALTDDQRGFFFVVPSFDRLHQALLVQGWEIKELDYKYNRNWHITIQRNQQKCQLVAASLELVFLEALTSIIAGHDGKNNSGIGIAQAS